ncbi:unnamed protein product [Zymoseptoria tritici ST99CH_1A5]|uniref:Altered inheritance of mitochondria protein 41 n=3 Tax=Zymoseptoria tritici TaxID=1047171 RepID=A0A1X7RUT0_ZYMT9|nr:unnamed protein product [Zymoseptoria tritici ST99CH_3D7]SMR53090.1 unnamed protein product [Zymoseptoria tritici ST99CH_1E4]SMR54705.1 unnamed protein product [Zymoseptoria tritici ST99CH_3D1]SMY24832.1 unnamed protein product [Zymoseptoria tritici ST99CH_1A5]
MSLNATRSLLRSRLAVRTSYVCPRCRTYATPIPPAPPLLLKLKGDLKTAMKAKDTNRLNVLRTILAEVTNSAKSPNPIKSDMQLLSLLRKRAAAAKNAGDEFKAAGREDLVEKEEQQAAVMEEYAGSVETLSEDDIKAAVRGVVDSAEGDKPNMGVVLKTLLGPGGSLEGKPVDRAVVARLVKQVISGES